MIVTINNRFSEMNEEGVEALFNIIMAIPKKERWMITTTPERIAELDALKEQTEIEEKQAEEEAYKQKMEKINKTYYDHAKMFDTINNVHIPARYNIGNDEIEAIGFVHGQISKIFPKYTHEVANDYFCYGFAKGLRYAKAETKKKATNGN